MRLIDAHALSQKWQDVLKEKADEKDSVAYQTFELFIDRLKNEPTIDAERVVRCGKCRYASDDIGAIARRYGKRGAVKCCNPKSIANNRLCLSDDFCSYGKEKE